MSELSITMLGPSRVGKTSLLVSMYQHFQKTAAKAKLQLLPDDETMEELDEKLGELQDMVQSPIPTHGVLGTGDPRKFTFAFGRIRQPLTSELSFHDYPGAYTHDKDQRSIVRKEVQQCMVTLVAIDAAALMEARGDYHQRLNKVAVVTDIFKNAYNQIEEPRLVILAPVKCEKYMQEGQSEELLTSVMEGYEDLLSFFGTEEFKDKVAVVVTPVQTVGTLQFA